MKRIFFLLLIFFTAQQAMAQNPARTVTPPAFTSSLATQAVPINLIGTGVNLHKFTWNTQGTVSAGACALQAGSNGVTFGTTLIAAQTVTSSGGPTTLTSGVYNYVRLSCTTPITGTGSVTITYTGYVDPTNGSATLSGALPAGTNAIGSVSSFSPLIATSTAVYTGNGSAIYTLVGTSGVTSVITANTVYVNFIKFTNITSGAITVTVTDTAGLQEETSFSIPANSVLFAVPPGAWLKYVGLKMWASATSSINLHMSAVN